MNRLTEKKSVTAVRRRREKGQIRHMGLAIQTTIHKTDKQPKLIV